MKLELSLNDAWDSIWLGDTEGFTDFLDEVLQPTHPLREFDLIPLAKCWRKDKYFVVEEEPSDFLWLLDFGRKKRVKGKTCYYFKLMKSQEEVDAILTDDLEWWVQYMKDAGAWNE